MKYLKVVVLTVCMLLIGSMSVASEGLPQLVLSAEDKGCPMGHTAGIDLAYQGPNLGRMVFDVVSSDSSVASLMTFHQYASNKYEVRRQNGHIEIVAMVPEGFADVKFGQLLFNTHQIGVFTIRLENCRIYDVNGSEMTGVLTNLIEIRVVPHAAETYDVVITGPEMGYNGMFHMDRYHVYAQKKG